MNVRKHILGYAVLQAAFWMDISAVYGFAAAFLQTIGMSSGKTGVILCLSNLAAAVIQPLAAAYADRKQGPALVQICAATLLCALLASLALALGIGYLPILFFLLAMLLISFQTPLNVLASTIMNLGIPLNYGASRAVGSLAYGVTALVLGRCFAQLGTQGIAWIFVALQILLVGLFLLFFHDFSPTEQAAITTKVKDSARISIGRLAAVLIGTTILFVCYNAVATYLYQIMLAVNGTAVDFGKAASISSLAELPMLFGFSFLAQRWKSGILMKLSGAFFTVRLMIFLFADSVVGVYFAQTTQVLSYAMFLPASVLYMNELMPQGSKAHGQALMSMAITLGGAFGTLMGGTLLEACGIHQMICIFLVLSTAGSVLLWAGASKTAFAPFPRHLPHRW